MKILGALIFQTLLLIFYYWIFQKCFVRTYVRKELPTGEIVLYGPVTTRWAKMEVDAGTRANKVACIVKNKDVERLKKEIRFVKAEMYWL